PSRRRQQAHDQGGQRQKSARHALPLRATRRETIGVAWQRRGRPASGRTLTYCTSLVCTVALASKRWKWLSVGARSVERPGRRSGKLGVETRWTNKITS